MLKLILKMILFKRVTIIGLGLIGGSLGMAIRRKHLAKQVVGFSRKAATLRAARRKGAINSGTQHLRAAVANADLVILATPVDLIVPLGLQAARWMKPGSILTDVGSTKGKIGAALDKALPRMVSFIGGHPIAGSEQRGIGAAASDLFDGSLCILTPSKKTRPVALRKVAGLWKLVADELLLMDAKKHDELLGATSHLSHLVAFALAGAVSPKGLTQTPRSFLDMTRIAKSNPDLWDDILLTNRDVLIKHMDAFSKNWKAIRQALVARNPSRLRQLLAQAKAKRDALNNG